MLEHDCSQGEHRIAWVGKTQGMPPPDGTYFCMYCREEIVWVNDATGPDALQVVDISPLKAESNSCPTCAKNGVDVAAEDCKLGHITWPK